MSRADLGQRIDAQPVLVDRYGHEARTRQAKRIPGGPLTEGLDGHHVARSQERARREIQSHLAAAGDQYGLG